LVTKKGTALVSIGGQRFGALLRQLRTDRLLTIKGLAEASGVSVRGIGDLERGRRAAPQRRTVAALADGLRLDDEQREALLAAAREGRTGDPAPVAVRTFPRSTDDFVGRRHELSLLAEAAGAVAGAPRPVVVALSGPPGAGKTALALRAAQELAGHFPDGQMVLDLHGMDEDPPSAGELMLGILKEFHVPDARIVAAGPAGQAGLYESVLADRRCLLILDNARDEAQVTPLLPRRGRSMCLVTSRKVLTGLPEVRRVRLGELSPEEAVTFLGGTIGEERASREADALREVAQRCGCLPLALRIAGNWLATRTGWSVRRLADRLAVERRRLDVLVAGDRKVSAAFDLSYRQLTPDAARLFRRLSVVPGPDAGVACAAQLLDQNPLSAEDVLDELIETGLLVPHGDRYRLHDLLRLYAHGRLAAEEGQDGVDRVRAGLYHWLLETTIVAGRWFEPGHGAPPADRTGLVDLSSADLAREWLRSQGINWLAALRAAAEAGEHARVVEVAEALHWFSDQWMFWGHWSEVFDMAVRAADALGDDTLKATHLNHRAWTLLLCEGRPLDSLSVSAEAFTVALRAGDVPQQAWACYYQGWAYRELERYAEGAEHFDRAASLFAAAGDPHGDIQAQHARSHNLLCQGDAAAALDSYQRALAFLDGAGDLVEPHIAASTRIGLSSGIGKSFAALEKWDEAIAGMRAAVRHCAGLASPAMESGHLFSLGEVLLAAGRPDEAREAFRSCVAIGGDADPQRLADARAHLLRLTAGEGAEALSAAARSEVC
jgi:tetratricopeptide (TPR) repeat protein/transcriptional regulator with XRE-family HTH domain